MVQRGRSTKRPAKTSTKSTDRDVTQYADKEPTEFHKCFARWITTEVGYDPNAARSKREAFLMGLSIATAARPAFSSSQYLEDWRAESGEAKRGPKPKNQQSTTKSKGRSKPAPEPEPEEDEVNDDWTEEDIEERQEELETLTVAKLKAFAKSDCEATAAELKGLTKKSEVIDFILDFEFPEDDEESDEDEEDEEDEDEDDEFDEEDEEDEEDEDEEDEEEEPEPPKSRGRGRPASSAKSSSKTTRQRPAKGATGGKASGGKGEYLF